MRTKYLIASLLFCIGFICKNETNNKEYNKNVRDTIYDCEITKNISQSIIELKNNVKIFNKNYSKMDNCYLSFIDSLYSRFYLTRNIEYLEYIDLISSESDGYVS